MRDALHKHYRQVHLHNSYVKVQSSQGLMQKD